MRARLSRFVRRNPVAQTLLDNYPVRIQRMDGSSVTGTRRASRIFGLWSGDRDLRAESVQALEAYEGGDLVDVGAFQGWYSLLLAPRARPGDSLVSIEPDRRAFPELLANLDEIARWSPDLRLHALNIAVGNGKPMRVEWPLGPDAHPSFSSDAGAGEPTPTLDSLTDALKLKPAFVKIDVEGAEAFVLEGMDQVLDRHAPVVMLEIHPQWQPQGYTVDGLIQRMKKHGYRDTVLSDQPLARRVLWRK
jgi:FkbM family methyltransferase